MAEHRADHRTDIAADRIKNARRRARPKAFGRKGRRVRPVGPRLRHFQMAHQVSVFLQQVAILFGEEQGGHFLTVNIEEAVEALRHLAGAHLGHALAGFDKARE